MPSQHTLTATLKRLLGRPAGTNAVRGTWRDVRPAPSYRPYTGSLSAFQGDALPGFYRSEAFAEDLFDSHATPR
ncbi:MAG: hypothetical protein IV092_20050 [Burkholderiaceae bacterium]|nr:hypothetical protein [Burkholderiaceae bacterium]